MPGVQDSIRSKVVMSIKDIPYGVFFDSRAAKQDTGHARGRSRTARVSMISSRQWTTDTSCSEPDMPDIIAALLCSQSGFWCSDRSTARYLDVCDRTAVERLHVHRSPLRTIQSQNLRQALASCYRITESSISGYWPSKSSLLFRLDEVAAISTERGSEAGLLVDLLSMVLDIASQTTKARRRNCILQGSCPLSTVCSMTTEPQNTSCQRSNLSYFAASQGARALLPSGSSSRLSTVFTIQRQSFALPGRPHKGPQRYYVSTRAALIGTHQLDPSATEQYCTALSEPCR